MTSPRAVTRLDDFASRRHAAICYRRNQETHLRTRAPETLRELVRGQQGVIALPSGEQVQRFLGARPDLVDMHFEPRAKLESVKLCLMNFLPKLLFEVQCFQGRS